MNLLQNISARDDRLELDVHQERPRQLTVEAVGLLGRRRQPKIEVGGRMGHDAGAQKPAAFETRIAARG